MYSASTQYYDRTLIQIKIFIVHLLKLKLYCQFNSTYVLLHTYLYLLCMRNAVIYVLHIPSLCSRRYILFCYYIIYLSWQSSTAISKTDCSNCHTIFILIFSFSFSHSTSSSQHHILFISVQSPTKNVL